MGSQLNYFVALDQQRDLAQRAERARQHHAERPSPAFPRHRRLVSVVIRALRPRRALRRARSAGSEQRELPLAPRRVERAAVPAGCLEGE
jgi:hypothetical protein